MTYTVVPFYTDAAEGEHPWGKPFVIGSGDVHDSEVGAPDFVRHMLADGSGNDERRVGLRILDADGAVVFSYVHPAPSEA